MLDSITDNHQNPLIRQAIQSALDNGWNYGASSRLEHDLAKTVCDRFSSIDMIRFVNSGTEANMMALATALVVTKKKKILFFEKGYHGSTISARTAPGKPSVNLPHEFITGNYNDVQGTESLVSSLPDESLAAILVEPMLGSGGCYAASKEFLQTLRRIATEQKALLIFDEVMTSRLSYNGFHTTYGIRPDLMTLGKWIGGGMSFGAFGGRKDIMELYDPRKAQLQHPGTFNNNVFTMSAGIVGCGILTEQRLDQLNALGDNLRLSIEDVLQKNNLLEEGSVPMAPITDDAMHSESHPQRPPKIFVKGVGSLMNIHFAGPDSSLLEALFYHHMLEQGIYLAQRGFVALSLEIQNEHIDKFVKAVESFCRQWDHALRW